MQQKKCSTWVVINIIIIEHNLSSSLQSKNHQIKVSASILLTQNDTTNLVKTLDNKVVNFIICTRFLMMYLEVISVKMHKNMFFGV